MEENQSGIRDNIFIAETNLALNDLLTNRIFVSDGFGKKRQVPVFFRDRDSKIIADTTPSALITIGFDGYEKADGTFWDQCGILEIIEKDKDGLPLKFREFQAPDPILMKYTVTARTQHWDDMIALETALARLFPVTHTLFTIKNFKTHLYRSGYTSADSEELGIFIRNFSLEIIGYLFSDHCEDKIYNAIKTATVEVSANADPDSDPVEVVEIDC